MLKKIEKLRDDKKYMILNHPSLEQIGPGFTMSNFKIDEAMEGDDIPMFDVQDDTRKQDRLWESVEIMYFDGDIWRVTKKRIRIDQENIDENTPIRSSFHFEIEDFKINNFDLRIRIPGKDLPPPSFNEMVDELLSYEVAKIFISKFNKSLNLKVYLNTTTLLLIKFLDRNSKLAIGDIIGTYIDKVFDDKDKLIQSFSHFVYATSNESLIIHDTHGFADFENNIYLMDFKLHIVNSDKKDILGHDIGTMNVFRFFKHHKCGRWCRSLRIDCCIYTGGVLGEVDILNASTLFNLGLLNQYGNSRVPKDLVKSIEFYKKSGDLGNSSAYNNLGVIYEQQSENSMALEFYQKSSEMGNSSGLFNIGNIYRHGKCGVCPDIQKALVFYKRSAKLHNKAALYNLGVIYENGIYITKDIGIAMGYYHRAAQFNEPLSLNNLGFIYIHGKHGIPKDVMKAFGYLKRAAECENPNANFKLATIFQFGLSTSSGSSINQDIKKSLEYYKKAGDLGIPLGYFNYAKILHRGLDGVAQDLPLAKEYYEIAGDPLSLLSLGNIYYSNARNSTQDLKLAIDYYERSSNSIALFNLGVLYSKGDFGMAIDINKSKEYFERSGSLGNPSSFNNLGTIYYQEKNLEKAIEYYEKAGCLGDNIAFVNLGKIFQLLRKNNKSVEEFF